MTSRKWTRMTPGCSPRTRMFCFFPLFFLFFPSMARIPILDDFFDWGGDALLNFRPHFTRDRPVRWRVCVLHLRRHVWWVQMFDETLHALWCHGEYMYLNRNNGIYVCFGENKRGSLSVCVLLFMFFSLMEDTYDLKSRTCVLQFKSAILVHWSSDHVYRTCLVECLLLGSVLLHYQG